MALCHAILTALIEDDLSGYELARSFDKSLGFFWQASHQQIYRELKKMADNGLLAARKVPQQGKPDKIIYSLTDQGRMDLERWVYQGSRVQKGKDDLLVKLYNLNENNVAHLIAEVEKRREATLERLFLYEKIRRRNYADPQQLPLRQQGILLVLTAGIEQSEYQLTWCDRVLNTLAEIRQGNQVRGG